MKRFRTGLVVGKFCPLHRGHEWLICRALEQCDEVILISYTRPEFPGCEPRKRERWLAERFPQTLRLVVTQGRLHRWFEGRPGGVPTLPDNGHSDTIHRRFVGRLCLEVLDRRVDAVFTSETYGDGFADELSCMHAERDLTCRPVVHCLVDLHRLNVTITGEQLRRDPHTGRAFLSPGVYASFVRRIAILGAESSGKSTLAAALATAYTTAFAAEYGREFWEEKNGRLEYADLLSIARVQTHREDEIAASAQTFLFCDTTPLTTLFYSDHLFQRADPRLAELSYRRYDATILCTPDFPFVQDGTREGPGLQAKQHAWYLRQLRARCISPWVVTGSVEERVCQVKEHLASDKVATRSFPFPAPGEPATGKGAND